MPDTPHVDPTPPAVDESMPRGQRFFDNLHLLLVLGVVIMAALYAGWGMWEIMTLPKATLP
jgi:hypothetical protein